MKAGYKWLSSCIWWRTAACCFAHFPVCLLSVAALDQTGTLDEERESGLNADLCIVPVQRLRHPPPVKSHDCDSRSEHLAPAVLIFRKTQTLFFVCSAAEHNDCLWSDLQRVSPESTLLAHIATHNLDLTQSRSTRGTPSPPLS